MKKYRKKPVVIEAVQWVGPKDNALEKIRAWGCQSARLASPPAYLLIETLEGTMCASKGDWIIRGVKGEFYPCEPDVFEATYEEV